MTDTAEPKPLPNPDDLVHGGEDVNTTPDPVAEVVGPHTGVTHDDLTHGAEHRWGLERGTRPPWDQLDDDQRADLIRAGAAELLARFHTDPPAHDRRPVDHDHASSPPYPDGGDELGYWRRRTAAWIDDERTSDRNDGITITGDTDDPVTLTIQVDPAGPDNPYRRGQATEAISMLEALHLRTTPAATGQDEVAHWITSQQARVDALPDTDAGNHFRQGHTIHARMWLGFLRSRQRARSMPPQMWKRGGRVLVDALNQTDPAILAPTAADPIPAALVVIATHDELGSPPGDLMLTLRRYTGQPADECELAIRRAVDHQLIHLSGSLSNAYLTQAGDRVYRQLLDRITTD